MEHGGKTQFKLWILKSAIRINHSQFEIASLCSLPSALCFLSSNIFSVFRQLVLGILAASKGRSNGIVFALHRETNEQMHHKALARIFHVMKYPGLGLR